MKKVLWLTSLMLLSACSSNQPTTPVKNEQQLNPPEKIETGFFRLAPNSEYYIDSASIWVDNDKSHLINFDIVINLKIGHAVFEDKNLFSHSLRQHKVVNCKTHHLMHTDSYFYSEFWGQGLATPPKRQSEHTVKLREGSSLGTAAQIMCTNFYRS